MKRIFHLMIGAFRKSEYAAFMAKLKMNDGTAASVTTKSASESGQWEIEAVAPEFNAAGGNDDPWRLVGVLLHRRQKPSAATTASCLPRKLRKFMTEPSVTG